jgi:hypothetical protein
MESSEHTWEKRFIPFIQFILTVVPTWPGDDQVTPGGDAASQGHEDIQQPEWV